MGLGLKGHDTHKDIMHALVTCLSLRNIWSVLSIGSLQHTPNPFFEWWNSQTQTKEVAFLDMVGAFGITERARRRQEQVYQSRIVPQRPRNVSVIVKH